MIRFILLATFLALAGCGKGFNAVDVGGDFPTDDIVVKATYYIAVGDPQIPGVQMSTSSNSVTIVVSPNTTFTIDDTSFNSSLTVGSDTTIDLGSLTITALADNDLRQCPSAPGNKCNTGVVRSYTTGTPGAGLWNTADSYGLPINGGLLGLEGLIGLTSTSSYDMKTFALSGNKANLSDLGADVTYGYSVDASDAGAGSYSTTLVIEYGITYIP